MERERETRRAKAKAKTTSVKAMKATRRSEKQSERRNGGGEEEKGQDERSPRRFINRNKRLEPPLPCRFQTITIPKRIRISLLSSVNIPFHVIHCSDV